MMPQRPIYWQIGEVWVFYVLAALAVGLLVLPWAGMAAVALGIAVLQGGTAAAVGLSARRRRG